MNSKFNILLFLLLFSSKLFSQGCENSDFSYGNFDFWKGYTGFCCGASINTLGIVPNRHTIITSSYPDPNTNDSVMSMPPAGGGAYSVRLGNDNTGSEAERLTKTFTVNNSNKLFIYQYALVLEDPSGHLPIEKPKFEVKVMDQNGQIVDPKECGYYQVTSGSQTDGWGKNGEVRYKDWTTVGLDLSAYIGTSVTVEFTTQDCGLGGHFGYAYIDAACGFLDIDVIGFCKNSSQVTLIAPEGFKTYHWPINGSNSSSITIPKPNVGDSVFVEVTNEAGCMSKILHVFEELPVVDAVAWKDTLICAGQSVNLYSDGGGVNGKYKWYANNKLIDSLQNITVNPLKKTTYSVIVANSNGCYSADSVASVVVNVDSTLVFSLPKDTAICNATQFVLKCPLKGLTYNWSDSYGTVYASVDSIVINPTQSTTYKLTVSNGTCSYSDSIKIKVLSSGNYYPDTIKSYYCPNSPQLVLKGPNYCQSYNWSNNVTTMRDTINAPSFSSLKLKFIDNIGCPDSTLYEIFSDVVPNPIISAYSDTICIGSGANLSVTSNANCYYYWYSTDNLYTGSGDNIIFYPKKTTTFVVKATSFSGCSFNSQDTIIIHVDSSAFFTSTQNYQEVCKGGSKLIGVNNLTGSIHWTYLGSVISSNPTITVTPAFHSYYYLTRTVGNCNYTKTFEVNVNPVKVDTLHIPFCNAANSIQINSPLGYNSYYWPTYSNSSLSNTVLNPANKQKIPVYCTNSKSCVDTIFNVLDLKQKSQILPVLNDTICKGDYVSLTANSSGTSDFYSWTNNINSKTFNGKNLVDYPTVTTVYTITLSNSINCVNMPNTTTVTVKVDDPINAIVPASLYICPGDTVQLSNQNSGGQVSWNFNGVTYFTPTLKTPVVSPGYAVITVVNGKCTRTSSTFIDLYNLANYSIVPNPSTSICSGDYVNLIISPTNSINNVIWYKNQTYFDNIIPINDNPSASCQYSVLINDLNNCKSTVSLPITVIETPTVDLGTDRSLCTGSTLNLAPKVNLANLIYSWSNGAVTPTLTINQPGTYSLIVQNIQCYGQDNINISAITPSHIGTIPNVLTVNNDNINDELVIQNNDLSSFKIEIVNRWGEIVYQNEDSQLFWSGLDKNGNKVDDGVYYYKILYTGNCSDTGEKELSGFITVLSSK